MIQPQGGRLIEYHHVRLKAYQSSNLVGGIISQVLVQIRYSCMLDSLSEQRSTNQAWKHRRPQTCYRIPTLRGIKSCIGHEVPPLTASTKPATTNGPACNDICQSTSAVAVEERIEEAETWTVNAKKYRVDVADDGSEHWSGGTDMVSMWLLSKSTSQILPCTTDCSDLAFIHNDEILRLSGHIWETATLSVVEIIEFVSQLVHIASHSFLLPGRS